MKLNMKLNMKELRKSKKLTQQQLADAIGATKRQVGAWERGENDLPMDYAIEIADVLDCTVDNIAGRESISYAVVSLPDGLTTDEREILSLYRSLDETSRQMALRAIRGMASVVSQGKNQEGEVSAQA